MKTSKVNCKHQKSIANSKFHTLFWEQIAISVCFCCWSAGKGREIWTMNLWSHTSLRYWMFHQRAMFISSFGLCSRAELKSGYPNYPKFGLIRTILGDRIPMPQIRILEFSSLFLVCFFVAIAYQFAKQNGSLKW